MIDEIQKRLEVVEVRNRNKDLDKAWERSWSRKLFIVSMTYLFASLYLYLIGAPTPFINAVVPAGGFMLSHLSLKQIEDLWLKHVKKARR
jgi:amino acid transporter